MSGEIARVFRTLVEGFNNIRLTSGDVMQSTTKQQYEEPALVWRVGGWNSEFWQTPFKYRVIWDLAAELRIKTEPGNPLPLIDALDDIDGWSSNIYGLPIDKNGELVVSQAEREKLAARGELYSIADRFAGPWVKLVKTRAAEADDAYAVADVVFHVEFVVDNSPRVEGVAKVFEVGANAFGVDHANNPTPDGEPYSIPLAADADVRAQGAFATPYPRLTVGGHEVAAGFPPVIQGQPGVEGADPSTTLMRIDVVPAAFSLHFLESVSLLAMGVYLDGSTANLTGSVTWSSDVSATAYVSASGVVTGAAGGSTTITASLGGLNGSSAVSVLPMVVTAVKTSAYTAAAWESVRTDPTSAAFTVTLPTSVGASGVVIIVTHVTDSANLVTVDGAGSETIDGVLTIAIGPRESVTLMSDGANWMVI